MYAFVYTYRNVCLRVLVCVYLNAHIHIFIHRHVYIHLYVYVNKYKCTKLHTHICSICL